MGPYGLAVFVNGGGGKVAKKNNIFLLWPGKGVTCAKRAFELLISIRCDTLNNETSVTSNSFSKFGIGT